MSVYCQNCDHLRAENEHIQAELDKANRRIAELEARRGKAVRGFHKGA